MVAISTDAFELQELIQLAIAQAAELQQTQRKIAKLMTPELIESLDAMAQLSAKLSAYRTKKPKPTTTKVQLRRVDSPFSHLGDAPLTPEELGEQAVNRNRKLEEARDTLAVEHGCQMFLAREVGEMLGCHSTTVEKRSKDEPDFPQPYQSGRYKFYSLTELQPFIDKAHAS